MKKYIKFLSVVLTLVMIVGIFGAVFIYGASAQTIVKDPQIIVFVDYDGVMIPQADGKWIEEGTYEDYASKYGFDASKYDSKESLDTIKKKFVQAICNFGRDQVKALNRICKVTGAKIVISSDWRRYSLQFSKDLFKYIGIEYGYGDMSDLVIATTTNYNDIPDVEKTDAYKKVAESQYYKEGGYYGHHPDYDYNDDLGKVNDARNDKNKNPRRAVECWDYVYKHENVVNFCCLDDMPFGGYMEGHHVHYLNPKCNVVGCNNPLYLDLRDEKNYGLKYEFVATINNYLKNKANYVLDRVPEVTSSTTSSKAPVSSVAPSSAPASSVIASSSEEPISSITSVISEVVSSEISTSSEAPISSEIGVSSEVPSVVSEESKCAHANVEYKFESGQKVKYCKDCGAELERTKPTPTPVPHTHNFVLMGQKAATYFAKGYSGDQKCSCGLVYLRGNATAKKVLTKSVFKLTKGTKCFKITIKKVAGAKGFNVQYKKGEKVYKRTIKTSKKCTKKIKNLKKGKYKVRLRAYNSAGQKSNWTKYASVKVK